MAKHNQIGSLGESIAAKWLTGKGYTIISTNYRLKWGEIDIIARSSEYKVSRIHFVEVKTVSYETPEKLNLTVPYETWRPEEKINPLKLKKLSRVIETWLIEKSYQGDWQIDGLSVHLVPRERYAKVLYIPNIILE